MIDPHLIDMIIWLRSRGISDNNLLRAMELVPRKAFLPDALYDKAYKDLALPIACGQSISSPLTIALMVQMLMVGPDHKVLEIGTGTGYQAAILAKMATRVYSVERYKSLVELAEDNIRRRDVANVVIRHGDGEFGWKGQAPYDRIILSCAVNGQPKRLISQLADNGMLVCSINGHLMRYHKQGESVLETKLFEVTVPPLEPGKSLAL